jgi:hypothetical protein
MGHKICPKCQGDMQPGFVMDKNNHLQAVAHWFAGQPKKSFWIGTKTPDESFPLGAYRCINCNYVEFFADSEFEPN